MTSKTAMNTLSCLVLESHQVREARMKNIITILICSIFACMAASTQAGEVPQQKEIADDNFISIHIIGIDPDSKSLTDAPCELILTDPKGRKTGFDAVLKKLYHEIPGADYGGESIADAESGEPGPASLELHISAPLEGDYQLEIIGLTSGLYSIEMQTHALGIYSSNEEFKNIYITKGGVHKYKFNFQKKQGFQIKIIKADSGKTN